VKQQNKAMLLDKQIPERFVSVGLAMSIQIYFLSSDFKPVKV